MKSEESVYRSRLEIGAIKQIVRDAVGDAEISPVQFDVLDDPSDLAVAVRKHGFLSGYSAIQVLVDDEDDRRLISVIALGDSGAARAWGGAANTVSLSGSRKLAGSVVDMIRQHDSELQRVG